MSLLEDYLGGGAAAAAAAGLGAAGLALAERGYSAIGDIGERAYEEFAGEEGLADRLTGMLEFQPYTVTTATGGQFGMRQDPVTGEMSYGVETSPEERALQQRMLTQAGQFYDQAGMSVEDREQQVFERMMGAITPQQERERLALEQRLAAQGRLGTQTAMFGGTPEALTLAKAQEDICRARAEQRRAALAQQAQTYGETYATGLEALLAAGQAQAGLAGGFGTSLAQAALGGLFSSD